MGLNEERTRRRNVFERAVQQAYEAAIADAEADFDERDATTLRAALEWWLEGDGIPETVGGKAIWWHSSTPSDR